MTTSMAQLKFGFVFGLLLAGNGLGAGAETEIRNITGSAPAPGAVFRAPAENSGALNWFKH